MIAHLRGVLIEKLPNQAVVDVGGVGYDLTIPVSTYLQLPDKGGETALNVYTHVREDALALFGFATKEERNVFERLITVSGIGPKLAVTILSGLATPDLVAAVRAGDVTRLTRIPGVGKKTAERMVLELKEKLDLLPGSPPKTAPAAAVLTPLEQDVFSALINLGSQRAAAEAALAQIKRDGAPDGFEAMFRRALELLR
jgi:Holliday junction DNA helicase RuvA